jgi:hypothetical protein
MEDELKQIKKMLRILTKALKDCYVTNAELTEDLIENSIRESVDELELMREDIEDQIKQAYRDLEE